MKIINNNDFWDLCDQIIQEHGIVVDRPKGSAHPKYQDLVYPLDYGYIKDTGSMDLEGIDVWIGSVNQKKVVGCIVTIDSVKNDSEIKLLYSCTEEEMFQALQIHNRTCFMKGLLVERL